jgi:hypothetical protein
MLPIKASGHMARTTAAWSEPNGPRYQRQARLMLGQLLELAFEPSSRVVIALES